MDFVGLSKGVGYVNVMPYIFHRSEMAKFSFARLISLLTKVMMSSSAILDAILYYFFHFIYLGYPTDVLARLWLAHDIAHRNTDVGRGSRESQAHQAWKTFDDSMRESYKAIGTLAGLLAGAISGLSSVSSYRDDARIRVLLLAGLTASVISASSCLSMLSTVYVDPVNIELHWKSSGIIYIITLSGPSAWLAIALWLFQASILVIVWVKESTAAKVIVTVFIGIRVLIRVAAQLQSITPVNSRIVGLILGLLGWNQGMSHHMVHLNQDSILKRDEYLRALARVILETGLDASIPNSVFTGMEREHVYRGKLEAPTKGDLNL